MFCPNCGTEALGESNYCRSCGVNLLPVTMLVKGQELVSTVRTNPEIATRISNCRMMQLGIATLFIGLAATIIFGVLNFDTLAGISSALIIAGAGMTAFPWLPGLMNKELGKYAVNSIEKCQSNQLEIGQQEQSFIEKRFQTSEMYAVPSVTEHTTLKLDENRVREKA